MSWQDVDRDKSPPATNERSHLKTETWTSTARVEKKTEKKAKCLRRSSARDRCVVADRWTAVNSLKDSPNNSRHDGAHHFCSETTTAVTSPPIFSPYLPPLLTLVPSSSPPLLRYLLLLQLLSAVDRGHVEQARNSHLPRRLQNGSTG